jgi:hypothetical protein
VLLERIERVLGEVLDRLELHREIWVETYNGTSRVVTSPPL